MITIIAAHDNDRVIGYQGTIPWNIKADMRNFKTITTGHIVIMGRKTYQSMGKALKNRINIVVSRNPSFSPQDALVFASLEEALAYSMNWDGKLVTFLIGGEQIYKEGMKYADNILITHVKGASMGDAHFPEIDMNTFFELTRSDVLEENGMKYQYISYNKKHPQELT